MKQSQYLMRNNFPIVRAWPQTNIVMKNVKVKKKHPSVTVRVLIMYSLSTTGNSSTSLTATMFIMSQTQQPADVSWVTHEWVTTHKTLRETCSCFVCLKEKKISANKAFLNHQLSVSVLKILYYYDLT